MSIKRSLVMGLFSAGAVAVPGMALVSAQFSPTPTAAASTPTTSITASQADQVALTVVGGGTVTNTSSDTYQGSAVYDIHVLYNSTVYDVKVLMANGSVVLKKVSNEQSSASSPKDHSTSPKSNAPEKVSAPENGSPSPDKSNSARPTRSGSGITYGVKLTAVPGAFQTFVNQALAQQHGTFRWVKFSSSQGSDTQMNIKIKLSQGGTVKVIDLFSASNQLIRQSVGS